MILPLVFILWEFMLWRLSDVGRAVDAVFMDLIAQNGLLQWRYALGIC